MKRRLKKLCSIVLIFSLLMTTFVTFSLTASAAEGWHYVGDESFALAGSIGMAISSSGTPYVVLKDIASTKAVVMKYDGSQWVKVGDYVSEGQADYLSIAVYQETPYVAYMDYANSQKLTVKKYDGSQWVTVGTEGFSSSWGNYNAIKIAPDGTPYVFYSAGSASNMGCATVVKFDGTSWVQVGTFDKLSTTTVQSDCISFDSNGIPYVAFADTSSALNTSDGHPITVMKYNSTSLSWDFVGSRGFSPAAADLSLSLDGNTPYISYSNLISFSYGKASVEKYDAASSTWVYVGSPKFTAHEAKGTSLAFYNGVPYLAYIDHTTYTENVVQYDSQTSTWVNLGNADFATAFSSSENYDNLVFDSTGKPYVSFIDTNGMTADVMSFGEYTPKLTAPTITLASDTANGGIRYTITPDSSQTSSIKNYVIDYFDMATNTQKELTANSTTGTIAVPAGHQAMAEVKAISSTDDYLDSNFNFTNTPATSALAPPAVQALDINSTSVKGTTEAGATVTVQNTSETTLGTITANPDGTYEVSIPAQAVGTVLYVYATDTSGDVSAPTTVTVNPVAATAAQPTMSAPSDATVNEGATATFSVTASTTDGGSLTYQWQVYKNGAWSDISGATSASYTTGTTTSTDNGNQYRCVVTNTKSGTLATATSSAAALTVNPVAATAAQPTVSAPSDATVNEGATATFSVTASTTDGGSLTYQWQVYKNGAWSDISGATSASYTTGTTTSTDNGNQYRCVVTNTKSRTTATATSSAAALTVNPVAATAAQPTVSAPSDATVNEGATATFSVTASTTDGGSLTYQWQVYKNGAWSDISGATSASYTTDIISASDAGTQYRCVVTDTQNGTKSTNISSTVVLTVNAQSSKTISISNPNTGRSENPPLFAASILILFSVIAFIFDQNYKMKKRKSNSNQSLFKK